MILNVDLSLCLLLQKENQKLFTKSLKVKYFIATSVNGWINELLTLRWCNEVLGQFSFSRQFLAWDFCDAHLTDDVKKYLKLS